MDREAIIAQQMLDQTIAEELEGGYEEEVASTLSVEFHDALTTIDEYEGHPMEFGERVSFRAVKLA